MTKIFCKFFHSNRKNKPRPDTTSKSRSGEVERLLEALDEMDISSSEDDDDDERFLDKVRICVFWYYIYIVCVCVCACGQLFCPCLTAGE